MNLSAGLRLLFLRRVHLHDFHVSGDHVLSLAAFLVAVQAVFDFVSSGSGREFDIYGPSSTAALLFLLLIGAYGAARLHKAPAATVPLAVVLLSIVPLLYLVARGTDEAGIWSGMFGSERAELLWPAIIGLALAMWLVVLVYRAIRMVFASSALRTFAVTGACLAYASAAVYAVPIWPFWYGTESTDTDSDEPIARLDVEGTYYAQWDLVWEATEVLEQERPGVSDLYFLGFAGYGKQDVFMKETLTVQELFDQRFDTKGRSISLINNSATVDELPLANSHNLRHALDRIAERMNLEEDVLFLFLTSHGSRNHRLSTRFERMRFNSLDADVLGYLVAESGIQWRVIVVSACYSGGFIEPLKDDKALIITASRADRNSFGCGDKNELTDFGRAYFDEQLREDVSFVEAFENALPRIHDREQRRGLTPSEPQIHVGVSIRPKLDEIEARIRRLNDRLVSNAGVGTGGYAD